MNTLPIFVTLTNKLDVVIGGGDVALRKIQTLLSAGANVKVIAEHVCPQINAIASNQLSICVERYNKSHLAEAWLVIAATNKEMINDLVHQDALELKIFVNVVDDPKRCHFIFPAIIDRSPIIFAISSGGTAPVFARLWKQKLEVEIPQWTGKLARLAGTYRQKVKNTYHDFKQRRHFWERFFRGPAITAASREDWPLVESIMNAELTSNAIEHGAKYQIYYGNGDPSELTIKSLQIMQLADVIVHQPDTPVAILDLTRKDADRTTDDSNLNSKDIVVYLRPSQHCYWQQME